MLKEEYYAREIIQRRKVYVAVNRSSKILWSNRNKKDDTSR